MWGRLRAGFLLGSHTQVAELRGNWAALIPLIAALLLAFMATLLVRETPKESLLPVS